jgi:hypothetical protein
VAVSADLVVAVFANTIEMAATTNRTMAEDVVEVDSNKKLEILSTITTANMGSTATIAIRTEATSHDLITTKKMLSIK